MERGLGRWVSVSVLFFCSGFRMPGRGPGRWVSVSVLFFCSGFRMHESLSILLSMLWYRTAPAASSPSAKAAVRLRPCL